MSQGQLAVDVVVSMPFAENTYLVCLPGRSDCVIVDPGMEPDRIFEAIDEAGLEPVAILLTHGHCDHIAGIPTLKRRWPQLPVAVGRIDAPMLTDARLNLSAMFGLPYTVGPADELLDHGAVFSAAGMDFETRDLPGHSPGHVIYLVRGTQPQVVVSGDVLFRGGGIGRVDFPGGDFDTLARGIRAELYTLPDDTILLPGHGPTTTVGREKRDNEQVPPLN